MLDEELDDVAIPRISLDLDPSSNVPLLLAKHNAEWDIKDRKPSKKRKVLDGVLIPAFNRKLQPSPKLEEQSQHVIPSQHRDRATSNSGPGDTASESDEKPDLTNLRVEEYEIKPKIKPEMNIDSITFQARIARVSASRYPVTLEPASAQWQPVSRKFISRTYGGSESLEKHPDAPKRPGEPGIWYDSSPMEYTEDFDTVRHGFARMSSDKWLYLGDYKQCATEALTQHEWLLQSDKFHRIWTSLVQTKPWARRARASIHLRKEWSREPTMEEIEDAATEGEFKNVTIEEVKDAFDQGQQRGIFSNKRLGMLVLKCIGYDNDFQKELIDNFSHWIPPAKKSDLKKSSKATSNPQTKRSEPKRKPRAKRGKKRQKQVESEGDSEESGSFEEEGLADAG
ncbi:hypothetical protein F5876DRAFT_80260 [Lentinula aff. lateritia]|uniref:Uncharacterized protein n=1 Tax=Lentinula aff. lateritia TaxID=2804960 RepID=A0ACC1TQ91_9AGAR|nr:hypothetical protein F5876DRAFT_80260 [Lentinula aff. lateritia]